MPQTLLLRLPSPGQEETEWLTIDDSGESETIRQRGSLTLAAAVSRTGKVIALAPATQILLAEPELPPRRGVTARSRGRAPVAARLGIGPERRGSRAAGHLPGYLADAGKPRSN